MITITYCNKILELEPTESVLDALLKAGFDIPYSCKASACQSCMMQATQGTLPKAAQNGLQETLKIKNFFLSCSCYPKENLTIIDNDHKTSCFDATVAEHEVIAPDILRIHLTVNADFSYYPGQYITLWKDDHLGRSYSLASLPQEPHLELHISRVQQGLMSHWLFEQISVGQTVKIQGPIGLCFYTGNQKKQPILLVGTGTGLAPLYGILKDALTQQHQGNIYLIRSAQTQEQLYLESELQQLSQYHPNFSYQNIISQSPQVDLESHIMALTSDFSGWQIFLCGAPTMVKTFRKTLFMQGAKLQDIYSDAFLHTKVVDRDSI